jgi:hypothetical protein
MPHGEGVALLSVWIDPPEQELLGKGLWQRSARPLGLIAEAV